MTYKSALKRLNEKLESRLARSNERLESEDFDRAELAYERGFRAATKLALEDVEMLRGLASPSL